MLHIVRSRQRGRHKVCHLAEARIFEMGSIVVEASIAATRKSIANRRFPWLEWLLVVAGQAFYFQAFPDAWPRLGSAFVAWLRLLAPVVHFLWAIVDVRQWSLMGTAVRLAVILVFLVGLKAWKDQGK